MSQKNLSQYATEHEFCAVCWSRKQLHIHHIVQGTGRQHHREGLVRLCERCHRALHDGGSFVVTKGHVLAGKREQDPEHYSPGTLAGMKHRKALAYDLEPYTDEIKRERRSPPQEYMMRSRDKGCRGEREAASVINDVCPHAMAYRAQQHSGTESSSDVVAPGMPDLWIEVKRVEKLNLNAAFAKASDQCGALTPVVVHRKNNSEWLLTCRLSDAKTVARSVLHGSVRKD